MERMRFFVWLDAAQIGVYQWDKSLRSPPLIFLCPFCETVLPLMALICDRNVRLQKGPHHICRANMYKSNDRQSLITSQIVQNALINNKGIPSDVVGCLLKSDMVASSAFMIIQNETE